MNNADAPDRPRERRFICEIVEVHSGDDLMALVDLDHDGLFKKTRIRLHGVDTPDAYKEKAGTKAGSVRDQVRRIVVGKKCVLQVISEGRGGWISTLHVKDGSEWLNLNQMLIDIGYVYQQKREET